MSAVDTELVLVIPTQLLHDVGHFQGFHREVDRYLDVLLRPEHLSYQPRAEMELDPSHKQLIPYCLFRHQPFGRPAELFHYTRGAGQGEARLRAKRSVGVGGHVSTLDAAAGRGGRDVYREGLLRELAEEVHIGSSFLESCVGLINDDETEVGRVHLGVVHVFDLHTPDLTPREAEMLDSGFATPAQLLEQCDTFESWSQICLRALFEA